MDIGDKTKDGGKSTKSPAERAGAGVGAPQSPKPRPEPWTKAEDREGWKVVARGRDRTDRARVGTALYVELDPQQAAWIREVSAANGETQVSAVRRLIDEARSLDQRSTLTTRSRPGHTTHAIQETSRSSRRGVGEPPQVLVGTYGFAYKEWVGPFYPAGTKEPGKLPYYASVFDAVEMVHTYYGAPKAEAVERWREQTPEGFKISIKVPRWVAGRIQGGARREGAAGTAQDGGLVDDLERMLNVLRSLGPRLGPLVLRIDSGFASSRGFGALRTFLEQWSSVREGAQLVIDFRHPSWFQEREAETLLQEHDVTWVWNDMEPQSDSAKRVPRAIDDPAVLRDTSSNLIYVKLSGSHAGKETHYTPKVDRGDELRRWVELVKQRLMAGPSRTAYLMLSDHYAGAGPDTAREVQALLRD